MTADLPRGPLVPHLEALRSLADLLDRQQPGAIPAALEAFEHHLQAIAAYTREDPYGSPVTRPPLDVIMEREGLARRYYLVGHPAWPDPLMIWPPTAENAADYHRQYVVEDDRPEAANARVMWRWEQGRMTEWQPPTKQGEQT